MPAVGVLRVMGVLNCTPDSFSDGGRFADSSAAVRCAREMIADGAAIIDVGGESTRPGAMPVPEAEEIRRVVPVIRELRSAWDGTISIDTSKPGVMRAAVAAGADMINDVWALRQPGALQVASDLGVGVALMHMHGEPATMQEDPRYADVVAEVCGFLQQRVEACLRAGIGNRQIILDPGFGFGKRLAHNLDLLRGLDRVAALGFPVMVGMSRKAMIGELTGRPVAERLHGSVAAAVLAVMRGANVVRTHDVRAVVDALRVVDGFSRGISQ